jgi:hypothetical protein
LLLERWLGDSRPGALDAEVDEGPHCGGQLPVIGYTELPPVADEVAPEDGPDRPAKPAGIPVPVGVDPYVNYPYIEWYSEYNGRVVLELDPSQVGGVEPPQA